MSDTLSSQASEGDQVEDQVEVQRTAVVTGSSSGIGRAIAVELAKTGYHVLVHGHRNRQGAEEVARTVAEFSSQSTVILADLAQPGEAQRLVEEAWHWRQGVDVWVNNAGADVLTGTAAEGSFEEKLKHLWQVDVRATMLLSRHVGRLMKSIEPSTAATIINVGWDQAERGMGGDSGEMFAATKGAIMAFTRSLAVSLAPQVRVNCVAPGWIKTSWADQASGYWQQRAVGESLLKRWGTPGDVASTVAFLASPQAAFITGQIIPVNGGFQASRPPA